jgi:hypothetical protein
VLGALVKGRVRAKIPELAKPWTGTSRTTTPGWRSFLDRMDQVERSLADATATWARPIRRRLAQAGVLEAHLMAMTSARSSRGYEMRRSTAGPSAAEDPADRQTAHGGQPVETRPV